MRLNSIAQAIFTADLKLAKALIKHSAFSAKLIHNVAGTPQLIDAAYFEEVFADAKRAHVDRDRQYIINEFADRP